MLVSSHWSTITQSFCKDLRTFFSNATCDHTDRKLFVVKIFYTQLLCCYQREFRTTHVYWLYLAPHSVSWLICRIQKPVALRAVWQPSLGLHWHHFVQQVVPSTNVVDDDMEKKQLIIRHGQVHYLHTWNPCQTRNTTSRFKESNGYQNANERSFATLKRTTRTHWRSAGLSCSFD